MSFRAAGGAEAENGAAPKDSEESPAGAAGGGEPIPQDLVRFLLDHRTMIRSLVRAVVHNATVTHIDPSWPAAARIDPLILRAAEILPFEAVEIVNLTSGERFPTWVEAGEEGSGEIRLHAGVRNPTRVHDIISIVCLGLLHDGQTVAHKPRIVTLDAHNTVIAVTEE